jgi:D-sedoheptulose 7-phosphate isomerase
MIEQDTVVLKRSYLDPVPGLTRGYVSGLKKVLDQLEGESIRSFVDTLLVMRRYGGTLYVCGNGGSAANAIHLANDFAFGVHPGGKALKVEALSSNNALITCIGNDIGYDNIFAHQLKVKANHLDVLLVLSGSGNSTNIVAAIKQATELGMFTAGILGYDGGRALKLLEQAFHFNVADMQISEDMQLIVGHILMRALYHSLHNELHSEER